MPEGQFEKLKIYAYKKDDFAEREPEFIEAMMNPENFVFDSKMEFQAAQGQGTSAVQAKFIIKPPGEMSFELLYDNTGIIDHKPRFHIADELEKLKNFLMGYDGEVHRPRFVEFAWGKALVKGVCSSLNITYKLFNRDGTPIRAVAKVTIREMTSDEKRVAMERRSSPDLTHYRTVKEGDILPLMCYRIYGHSKYYLQVAAVNGLSNFRQLQPGVELFFPPIDKITK